MTKPRRYEDPCGIARALDRVGERWALLVVRELLLGPKRFSDLRAGLPTVSPNVLSQRLDELGEDGVVVRRQLDPPARTWIYELTPRGRELEELLLTLARWGSRAGPPTKGDLSPDALLLALRTTFTPDPQARDIAVELRLDSDFSRVASAGGTIAVTRERSESAEATITTDAVTLRRLVFGDLALAGAKKRGAIQIEGSERAAKQFLRSFARPS
ncbi:winged helix-turn-helix transcriptional regulator [soil metagenome]